MEELINEYIKYMKNKYDIIGAMVTGSYVTQTMTAHSDIDLFFLGKNDEQSIRGREWFKGVEFEYFISPEWKYYDRIKTDLTSLRIYSQALILYDPEGQLKRICQEAINRKESYKTMIEDQYLPDYKFYVETLYHDGIDMYDLGDYKDFLFFTSSVLENLCQIVCKMHQKLPIYNKHGLSEMRAIDSTFGQLVEDFLIQDYMNPEKRVLWEAICMYIQNLLGDGDITSFERIQVIHQTND